MPVSRMTNATQRSCSQALMATRSRVGHGGQKYKVEARLGHDDYKEEAGMGQDKK